MRREFFAIHRTPDGEIKERETKINLSENKRNENEVTEQDISSIDKVSAR